MHLLAMALIAIRRNVRESRNLAHFMPERGVATRAFDLVVRNMFLMHELGGIFRAQEDGFIMTFYTLSLGDVAVSLHNAEMALLAGDPSGNILFVIEAPSFDLDIPFGFDMAGGTSSHGTRDTRLFTLWTSLVIVTDETVDFMNRQMFSLNKLGMTTGTPKAHSPSQLTQVFSMREGHVLVNHIPLEIIDLMATPLETACVADLGVGSTRPLP
jgi:hypothetical protein